MKQSTFNVTGIKSILHALAGIAIFVASAGIASMVYFFVPQGIIATVLSTVINISLLYASLALYCKNILHIPLKECRVRKPKALFMWLACSIILPIAVSAFFICLTPGEFSIPQLASADLRNQIFSAIFGACITAGITEELVFRGFIMRILEARWGKLPAILFPSLVFGLLHLTSINEPNMRDVLLLTIAGTSVGAMFSMVAYHSDSIWPSAIMHGIWNLVIVGGIVNIGVTHNGTNLICYTLRSRSELLTGGSFGIESSAPATISYLLVFLLAFVLTKKENRPRHTSP